MSDGVSNVNIVLYDYHPYTRRGELGLASRPSCNLILSFSFNSKTFIIEMIANRMTLNESLDAEIMRRDENNKLEKDSDEFSKLVTKYLESKNMDYQLKIVGQ